MNGVEDLVAELRRIEERLRDLAYDRLREAASGDADAAADEKAIRALGGDPEDF